MPGDRFIRSWARQAIRGAPRSGGIDKVYRNLCLGLVQLGAPFLVNLPFKELKPDDRVGLLGRGRYSLQDYDRQNPIVAGIGLMTHPSEWPTLCEDYPVAFYLQHSVWADNIYKPFFKDRCGVWPVGIDTDAWSPSEFDSKTIDFLIYDKIRWQRANLVPQLLDRVREELARRKLTYSVLRYGQYEELAYKEALRNSRAMIFLCEHESQGLAYQECLASDVPVLAWDQGWCLDPNRFAWGQPDIPATSVPYFDSRCGLRFSGIEEFSDKLTQFLDLERSGMFAPRAYVTETLTLKKCSAHFLDFLNEARRPSASAVGNKEGALVPAGTGIAAPGAGSDRRRRD